MQVIWVEVRLVTLAFLAVKLHSIEGVTSFVIFSCAWGTLVVITCTVSGSNPCGPGVGDTIVLRFALGLILGVKRGNNLVIARTIGGVSGASVALALVVLGITVPGTCSVVFVILNASVADVVVYGVLLKVSLLLDGGAVSVRFFLIHR